MSLRSVIESEENIMAKEKPTLVRNETIRKAIKLAQVPGEICIVLTKTYLSHGC